MSLEKAGPSIDAALISGELFQTRTPVSSPTDGVGIGLKSTSGAATLGLFANRSQFQVEFFENLNTPNSEDLCFNYVAIKTAPWFRFVRSQAEVRFAALIFEWHLPSAGVPFDPVREGMRSVDALPREVGGREAVEFASKLVFNVDNAFFVNAQLDVFEKRTIEFPATGPNLPKEILALISQLPLHQMRLSSRGLRFVIDINTKALAFSELPRLSEAHWARCLELLRDSRENLFQATLRRLCET